ncbi:MAG: AarF/UbiB family protein [Desulfobulbaceae bacterium]|jgi:ubiquinone biosynthesis protein|nr:AarF/UbiB family protein [Desulfobulbaceae bacterium]MDH3542950.1 AarF/UbiB family protein [Desulfobulbaceae bacterium]MDH3783190.1 AarF/UbiB family protein [Desulfobulbaceae bacterium]MDH3921848.1 AarF/UbiB family protein [Desulfobulbaceae bacterium]HKJ13384.1 AarF/UbiB family protein [Desulfobulbales bacterium]
MDLLALSKLGRFRSIVSVLFKYGFDDVAERLHLPGKILISKTRMAVQEMTTWERLRHTLEELGPTFVKFGQILSLRGDLLPAELIKELEKLQDSVAPVSFEEIMGVLQKALKKPLDQIFSLIDEEPLAAGSLAQVHRAVLKDENVPVALKIRRPDIVRTVEVDLQILEGAAPILCEHLEFARTYDFVNLVKELKRALLRELNFTLEARNMQIVSQALSGEKDVIIPEVYEDYTRFSVLTMDLIEGVKLKHLQPEDVEEREQLAKIGIRLVVKQVLENGFFHADPHPGNFLVVNEREVCLLDWGVVGILPSETRYELVELIGAIVDKEAEKVLDVLVALTEANVTEINERLLLRDILEILHLYHSVTVGKLDLGQLLMDLNNMLRTHHIKLPSDLALMFKAMVTVEGTARQIYPELDVIAEIEPFIKQLGVERWSPSQIWHRFTRQLRLYLKLQSSLPGAIQRILQKVEQGELNIQFKHENLGGLQKSLDNVSNRLSFSIILGSVIIGSSMIITTGVKPLIFGYPAIGLVGYLISAFLGLIVAFNIFRSRKF